MWKQLGRAALVIGLVLGGLGMTVPTASAADGPFALRPTADLALVRLAPRSASVQHDTLGQIDVSVRNNGPSATSAKVVVSASDLSGGRLVLQGATRTVSADTEVPVTCVSAEGSCTVPTLAPGESAHLVVLVRWLGGTLIHPLDVPGSPFHTATVRASVSSAAGVPEPLAHVLLPTNNSRTATVQIAPAPKAADLALANLAASASSVPHDGTVTYTMTVRNAGPLATPAAVTFRLMSFLGTTATLVGATVDGSPASCTATVCTVASLAAGQSRSLAITARFDGLDSHETAGGALPGELVSVYFTIASSATPAVPEPSVTTELNNLVTTSVRVGLEPTSASLSIGGLKAAQTSVPHLGIANFTMTVSNAGPLATPVRLAAGVRGSGLYGPVTGVVVLGLIGPSQVPCTNNVCSLPSLAPGQSVEVAVAMRLEGPPAPLPGLPFSDTTTVSFTVASSASPPVPDGPGLGLLDNTAATLLSVGLEPTQTPAALVG